LLYYLWAIINMRVFIIKNLINRAKLREKTLFAASLFAVFFISACATTPRAIPQADIERVKPPLSGSNSEILAKIEERNRLIEDDLNWIISSYEGLKIRKLNNLSEREYSKYSKYLDNEGAVYIIVHPAYFAFFQYRGLPQTSSEQEEKKNAVERLLSIPPPDINFSVLQAQERRTRDFLEYKSTEEKLLILILPHNYQEFKGYSFKKRPDEYTRYLNEITNLSDSVLFLESKTANRGYLRESDMVRLIEFLLNIGAKKVYLGGGYIGRCLEDFYIDLTDAYGSEDVYIVPELSDVSPKELTKSLASSLLMPDGTINKEVATKNLHTDAYGAQEVRPRLRNLP